MQSAYGVNYKNPGNKSTQCPKNNNGIMEWCKSKYTGSITSSGVYLQILPFKALSGTAARGPMLPSLFASVIAKRTRSCDSFWKMDWQERYNSMATHEPSLTLIDLFLLGSVKNYIYMITFKPWPIWKNESEMPLTRYQVRHVPQRAWQEVKLLLEIFMATIGAHVHTYYVASEAIWFAL